MSVAHSAHFASPPYPPVPIGEHIADNGEGMGEGITDSLARLADRLAVLASAAHIMERRAPRDVYARSIAHEACVLALDMRDTLARAQAGAPMRSPRIVDAAPSSSPTEAPEDAPDDPPEDAPAGEPRPYDPRIDRYTDWSTHPAFRWLDDPPDGYLLDKRAQWVLCPLCGCLDAVELGANDRMRCGCIPFDGELSVKYEAPRYNAESPRLLAAYHNARAARFGVHETRQKRGVGRRQTPPEARHASPVSGRATHSDARPHASLGASGADRGPDRGETGGAQ